jgi:hypothetical protein
MLSYKLDVRKRLKTFSNYLLWEKIPFNRFNADLTR